MKILKMSEIIKKSTKALHSGLALLRWSVSWVLVLGIRIHEQRVTATLEVCVSVSGEGEGGGIILKSAVTLVLVVYALAPSVS